MWEVRAFTGRDERGRPTQVSRTVRGTKKDALRVAAELTVRPVTRAASATVADLLAQWVEQNEATWAASTRRDNPGRAAASLADPLAKMPISRVSVADVERWHTRMRRAGVGETAVKNRHTVLRAAFTQAVRWGWLTANPVGTARLSYASGPPELPGPPTRFAGSLTPPPASTPPSTPETGPSTVGTAGPSTPAPRHRTTRRRAPRPGPGQHASRAPPRPPRSRTARSPRHHPARPHPEIAKLDRQLAELRRDRTRLHTGQGQYATTPAGKAARRSIEAREQHANAARTAPPGSPTTPQPPDDSETSTSNSTRCPR